MNFGVVILILVILLILILAIYAISVFNNLISLRNAAETAWGQIDTELQLRLDLIPSLVNTVKGYASHEKQTLENVILARSRAVNALNSDTKLAENDLLSGALSKLMLLTENYPNLKADSSFLNLQNQLSAIERRINLARRFYNESVLVYNTTQQQFPANLIAKPFNHVATPLFVASTESAHPPEVKF